MNYCVVVVVCDVEVELPAGATGDMGVDVVDSSVVVVVDELLGIELSSLAHPVRAQKPAKVEQTRMRFFMGIG